MQIGIAYASTLLLFLTINTSFCQAQTTCDAELKIITQAYNEGTWSLAKDASTAFIRNRLESCKTVVPQVYQYLIQSWLRMYDIDSAQKYYFHALTNGYKLNLEPEDEKIFTENATLKKHSVNWYMGIISSDIREVKFGFAYGLTTRWFLETSYNNRHFNHLSDGGDGVLGKPLLADTRNKKYYQFGITGYERYIDLAAYYKLPIIPSQRDVNLLYISFGSFVTYYVNSHVNTWDLIRHDTAGSTEAYQPYKNNRRFEIMDTLGLNMDLKQLYRDRFNFGFFSNVGSSINLKNRWQFFFEIKFAVGKNNVYRQTEFASYRPGVDYFFLVVGLTRKIYKVVLKKT